MFLNWPSQFQYQYQPFTEQFNTMPILDRLQTILVNIKILFLPENLTLYCTAAQYF